jgi:hypothetical protein
LATAFTEIWPVLSFPLHSPLFQENRWLRALPHTYVFGGSKIKWKWKKKERQGQKFYQDESTDVKTVVRLCIDLTIVSDRRISSQSVATERFLRNCRLRLFSRFCCLLLWAAYLGVQVCGREIGRICG